MNDLDVAFEEGAQRGRASGSWILDGNSTEQTARWILNGWNSGDPEVLDLAPSPLSGEWAGESIPELSEQYGIDLFDDELATAFEQGFSEGFWEQVCKDAEVLGGTE